MTTPGRIVLIGNEKGGTGKTTACITLAAIHSTAGGKTAILDADPGQHSATAWCRSRAHAWPDRPPIWCQTIGEGLDLPGTARRLADHHDLVVIDTGASDGPYLRAGLTCAHTMVLPTSTDALELWVLPRMESLLHTVAPMNPDLRVVIAASRVSSQRAPTAEQDLIDWISDFARDLRACEISVLVQRTAVARATAMGLGIHELPRPDAKASREAQAFYEMVMQP